MSHIVLNDEQAKILAESTGDVELRDSKGNRLGVASQQFTALDIRLAKERMAAKEPGRTTQEVLDRLSGLEER